MRDKDIMAYPVVLRDGSRYAGMTLRDYFAAKAMQSLVPTYNENMAERELAHTPHLIWTQQLVAEAYNIADAMLEVRGK